MPVPRVVPVLLFFNSKTLELEKQPEKDREDGNFNENKHGQEARKDSQEDHDGSNPAEVTMNGNELKLFCVLGYLVAISLVGVSDDHNDVEM